MISLVEITNKLLERLSSDLPGAEAHEIMGVPGRGKYPLIPEHAKKAAVLILLYEKIDRVFISFIKREAHEKDRHSGQISFPGGRIEVGDDYPIQTALREAKEEIGIPDEVEILGTLSPLYIPVSGFYVSPVIAVYHDYLRFTPQLDEVKEILEVDINMILDDASKQKTTIKISNGMVLNEVPHYNIQGTVIWGATAMILAELESMIKG